MTDALLPIAAPMPAQMPDAPRAARVPDAPAGRGDRGFADAYARLDPAARGGDRPLRRDAAPGAGADRTPDADARTGAGEADAPARGAAPDGTGAAPRTGDGPAAGPAGAGHDGAGHDPAGPGASEDAGAAEGTLGAGLLADGATTGPSAAGGDALRSAVGGPGQGPGQAGAAAEPAAGPVDAVLSDGATPDIGKDATTARDVTAARDATAATPSAVPPGRSAEAPGTAAGIRDGGAPAVPAADATSKVGTGEDGTDPAPGRKDAAPAHGVAKDAGTPAAPAAAEAVLATSGAKDRPASQADRAADGDRRPAPVSGNRAPDGEDGRAVRPDRAMPETSPAAGPSPAVAAAAVQGPSAPDRAGPAMPEAMALTGTGAGDDPAVRGGDPADPGLSAVEAPRADRAQGPVAAAFAEQARRAGPPPHQQIAEAIRRTTDRAVELRLWPEELGHVRMSLSGAEGMLSVQITVERQETLELIRRHIDVLARELRQDGFADLDLSLGREGGRQPGGGPGDDRAAPGSGERAAGAPAAEFGPAVAAAVRPAPAGSGRLDITL